MTKYKTTIPELKLKRIKTNFNKIKITDSKSAADYIRQFYSEDITIFESFFILLLNRPNNTIGYAKISQGGTAGTVIDTKIIAKYAIDGLASSIILAHNHPSGNIKPSSSDFKITVKIKNALEFLDIQVLDHLIISENNYYSFKDEGEI